MWTGKWFEAPESSEEDIQPEVEQDDTEGKENSVEEDKFLFF